MLTGNNGGLGIQAVQSDGSVTTVIPQLRFANGTVPNEIVVNGLTNDISVNDLSFAFNPDAIAVSSSGDLYIANSSPKLLLRYSSGVLSLVGPPDGGFQSDYVYACQYGLAAAPDGSIIVGDYGAFGLDRVVGTTLNRLAPAGIETLSPLTGGFRPSGVAVAPNGEIYSSNDGRSGATNQEFLIAVDPDGAVHLLNNAPPM